MAVRLATLLAAAAQEPHVSTVLGFTFSSHVSSPRIILTRL